MKNQPPPSRRSLGDVRISKTLLATVPDMSVKALLLAWTMLSLLNSCPLVAIKMIEKRNAIIWKSCEVLILCFLELFNNIN